MASAVEVSANEVTNLAGAISSLLKDPIKGVITYKGEETGEVINVFRVGQLQTEGFIVQLQDNHHGFKPEFLSISLKPSADGATILVEDGSRSFRGQHPDLNAKEFTRAAIGVLGKNIPLTIQRSNRRQLFVRSNPSPKG